MKDPFVRSQIGLFISSLQTHIAILAKQEVIKKREKICNFYSFHIYNRLYSIQYISSKLYIKHPVLQQDEYCLNLLSQTKYIHFKNKSSILKENIFKSFNIDQSIIEKVFQKMLLTIIEPYYETTFYKDMYGFRKGRSLVNAVAEVYKYLHEDIEFKAVIKLHLKEYLNLLFIENNILHIWFPDTFKPFLLFLFKKYNIDNFKKISIIDHDSPFYIIGPLFCNILLNNIYKSSYIYSHKDCLIKSSKHIRNNCVLFGEEIIFIVNIEYKNIIICEILNYLKQIGIEYCKKNISIYYE